MTEEAPCLYCSRGGILVNIIGIYDIMERPKVFQLLSPLPMSELLSNIHLPKFFTSKQHFGFFNLAGKLHNLKLDFYILT